MLAEARTSSSGPVTLPLRHHRPAACAAGIGLETVRVLAGAGARVIMTSRNLQAGQQAAKELTQNGTKVSQCILPRP